MNKADYLNIKQQLNFDKPLYAVILVLAFDVLLVWAAFQLLVIDSTAAYIASQLLIALFFFHNFGIMHEAGHANLHKNRWVNYIVGHYASLFCFMPFFGWKYIHHEHHVWNGNLDKDWTLHRFKKMRESQKIPSLMSFAWLSWVPIIAFMQQIFIFSFPFIMKKFGRDDKRMFWQGVFSIAWMVAGYAALLYLFPEYITVHNLWLGYLIYLIGQEMVNLPHHAGVPVYHTSEDRNMLHAWEQHRSTRSCYIPRFLSELLVLNFNLHIEHHMMPTLPWFRLSQARGIVMKTLGNEYMEVGDLSWNLENRTKHPSKVILNAPDLQ